MITRYLGAVHQTSAVQEFTFPTPRTLPEAVIMITNLNRSSHVYGITYWIDERDARS